LIDLVANNTMDEHIAALLWTIAEEKRSFVSAAVPQRAGKSTVLWAMLDHVPAGTVIHPFNGQINEIREHASSPDGGYLEVGEISTEPPTRYIWDEPVRALFKTLDAGYSLATTMHVIDANDLFHQICTDNEISDADASIIQYVIHCKRFGEDDESYWRRVNRVYEITGVENGVPVVTELFAWNEDDDNFIALSAPTQLNAAPDLLAKRADSIRRQAVDLKG
jgi:hypothetical protein